MAKDGETCKSGALASGGHIGFGNDPVYVKTRSFDTFSLPNCTEAQKETIRGIAERLDAHRRRKWKLDSELTLTGTYHVLGKVRTGEKLTQKRVRELRLSWVGILRELHDELDAAVSAAYVGSANLAEDPAKTSD